MYRQANEAAAYPGWRMGEAAWQAMMDELSIGPNLHTLSGLLSAYAEPHRFYHTSSHIEFCLTLFDEHRDEAHVPPEVECAIWFHDAIYRPMSGSNEAKSADWAARFLEQNGCSSARRDQVRRMIMATVHHAPAADADTRLLVDIDLAILGSDPKTYEDFEKNVRREYKWVPQPLYRRERRKILFSFLDRKSIFFTEGFQAKYEIQARRNVEQALHSL